MSETTAATRPLHTQLDDDLKFDLAADALYAACPGEDLMRDALGRVTPANLDELLTLAYLVLDAEAGRVDVVTVVSR
ncbi:hypothetical protein [Gordonia sp. CPCC 205333]|uniref:hypothetical protein n=1 Tax=Gordonia sp. CPCC 205333 TaxID=3140790 RepID=UPI003AF3F7DA